MKDQSTKELGTLNKQLQREIEERKRTEEVLRQSESKYIALVEQAMDGVVITQDRIYKFVNEGLSQITGYTVEEMEGMPIFDLVPPEYKDQVADRHRQRLAGKELSLSYETKIRCKNGTVKDLESRSRTIQWEGRPATLAVVRDVSERKRAEETARQQNEFLGKVLESLSHPFYVIDANDYGIVLANSAARLGDLSERPSCYSLTHRRSEPCSGEEHVCPLERVKRTKKNVVTEHTHYEEDGNARVVEVHGYPILDTEGNVVQMIEYCLDITERKEAEEKLRESGQKYRSLIETAIDGIAIVQDGMLKLINDSFVRMLGYSAEELIGAEFGKVVPPEKVEELIDIFTKRIAGGYVPQPYETMLLKKDGERLDVEVNAALVQYEGRRADIAFVRDITERKRAEEVLRDSERRYRLLAENVTDVICVVDMNLRPTYMSPSVTRLLGYSVEEAMTHTLEEAMTPSSVEVALKAFAEQLGKTVGGAQRGVTPSALELEFIRQDGSTVWAESTFSFLRDSEGKPVELLTLLRDITDRKRAEHKLRESEEKWRSLIQNAPDIVVTLDRGGTIQFMNRSISGLPPDQRIGGSLYPLLAPDNRDILKESLERTFQTGETTTWESRGAEGIDHSWYVNRLGPVKHDEEVVAAILISTDITDSKRAQEKLEKAYEQEKALRQELEIEAKRRVEFLRALVHELKTPVTAVMASGELLTMELPEGPLLAAAENLYRGAENLNRRIDELLDLARGELGMLKLQRAVTDPLQLIHRMNDDMSPVLATRGQSLVLEVPSSLPMTWADEDRLRQVLFNLLSNASKYMPEGGKVILKAREEGENLIVEVEDTGPGIDEEEQERLFDPYYRLIDDRERLSGLGLGLGLSKTLIELHGGQIWVKSEKGKGSTFGFSLPLATEKQLEGEAEAEEE